MTPQTNEKYWKAVRKRAKELKSDGCSGPALEVYQDCCFEHDVHYRDHAALGLIYDEWHPLIHSITRKWADKRFRQCMQSRSKLGRFSPMAWWRWTILRPLGERAWLHMTRWEYLKYKLSWRSNR
jgi:hypothetical protein